MGLTVTQIEGALTDAKGNISAAAKALDVSRTAVYERVEKNDRLKAILKDARESRVDNAEDKLGDAVDKGEAWAVCFSLKTLGKDRGYVEKQEIEHSGTIQQKPAHDLSKLSTEELETFKKLLAKTDAE